MTFSDSSPFPRGIVSVVQTPFGLDGSVDWNGLGHLVEDAVQAGANGLLAPVVASEVAHLSLVERQQVARYITMQLRGRIPLIVGASSDDPKLCREMANTARALSAAGWLVAVPQSHYRDLDQVVPFFKEVTHDIGLPFIIQDLEFGGPGLPLKLIQELRNQIPLFKGIKIETAVSGPKYTAVREAFGPNFYIAGGWAVTQMIEALDRGVSAMIPESSMVRVYHQIDRLYHAGQRDAAVALFRKLLVILSFTNQQLETSIAFFKRLLVKKSIFTAETMRMPGFEWDSFNLRIADELIEYYLELEKQVANPVSSST